MFIVNSQSVLNCQTSYVKRSLNNFDNIWIINNNMEHNGANEPTKVENSFTIPKRKTSIAGGPKADQIGQVGYSGVLANAYSSPIPQPYPVKWEGYPPPPSLFSTPLKRTLDAGPITASALTYKDSYQELCDQTLPKELLMMFQPLFCKLCSAKLSSNIMAKMHYKSKNHEKKLRKYLIDYSERTGEPLHKRAALGNSGHTKLADLHPRYFHCDVCDLPLTGKIHAESHYMGKNHQRVLVGKKAPTGKGFYNDDGKWTRTTAVKSDPTGRDGFGQGFILVKSENVTVDNSLQCELCNVAVTSLPQMEMHLQGQKHKKRLKQGVTFTMDVKEALVPELSILAGQQNIMLSSYRTPSGQFYCKTCNISLNSETQFMQHLKSKKHLKKFNLKE